MARKPRIEYPHALYHVIARGNRQESVFLSRGDFSKYLSLIKKYKKEYNFLLYAYALMRNHIHLLIEVSDTPLSKIMQCLQQTYTQFFNWKYGKTGHVFQGRYKALLCEKNPYLLELMRYIHLNPIRAKVAKTLSKYPWIGHHAYVRSLPHPLVDREFVLSLFHPDGAEARRLYRQFLRDGIGKDYTTFLDDTYEGRILGKPPFIQESRQHEATATWEDGTTEKIYSLEHICAVVGGHLAIPPDGIKSNVKIREYVRARRVLCYVARVYSGYTVQEISSFLGIDTSATSRYTQIMHRQMRTNRSVQGIVRTICYMLRGELPKCQA